MSSEENLLHFIDKLDTLCCICLKDNVKKIQQKIFWEEIYQKVITCTKIEFLNEESLPKKICKDCWKELEIVDKFRLKCENANVLLRKFYRQYLVAKERDENEAIVKVEYEESQSHCDNFEDNCQVDTVLADDFLDEDNKEAVKEAIIKLNIVEEKEIIKDSVENKDEVKIELKDVIEKENVVNDLEGIPESAKTTCICDICRKILKDKSSLLRHISIQHSEEKMKEQMFHVTGAGADRRFHCPECPHTTKRRIDMKIHFRIHSGFKPYKCDVCSRSFSQYGTLAGHKKTHSDTKYFTCQECGKQFKYRDALRNHQRVHSNEFNYICQLCNKGLKTEKSLQYHMKRHYKIKNHNCELCGATFVTRAELTKHKYCHENKKRFNCNQCDYSTLWRQSLEIHTRRHLKDRSVQCDQCEYTCYTKVELKLHKRKHSKEQLYQCPMCDERFKQSTSVNKHMRNKHGQKFLWGNVADRSVIK